MSEKQITIEKPRSELPIEQQANFEGSWTNLMCERLRNPEIQKQVIDLMWEQEQIMREMGKTVERKVLTRQEMEDIFEKKLESVGRDTPVSFSEMCPNAKGQIGKKEEEKLKESEKYNKDREVMNLEWIFPYTNKKLTAKQLNITESHEKGHVFRRYGGLRFNDKFLKAFDFDMISVSEPEFEAWIKVDSDDKKPKSIEELAKIYRNYLENPKELAERMSQLKNYFGMNGTDQFTKEHLAYVREHYIKDTDFDNAMTQFFQAITPEKEDAFIELINSAGI